MGFNKPFNLATIASPSKQNYKNYSQCQKDEHVKNNTLYHELKLLKVKDIYHLEMAKFMYLFHYNKLPNLFNQYFTSSKTVHKYNTRCTSYNNFYLHAINFNAAKKSTAI